MTNRAEATLMAIDLFVGVLVRARSDRGLQVQSCSAAPVQVLAGADQGRLGQGLQVDALPSDPGILVMALGVLAEKRCWGFLLYCGLFLGIHQSWMNLSTRCRSLLKRATIIVLQRCCRVSLARRASLIPFLLANHRTHEPGIFLQ